MAGEEQSSKHRAPCHGRLLSTRLSVGFSRLSPVSKVFSSSRADLRQLFSRGSRVSWALVGDECSGLSQSEALRVGPSCLHVSEPSGWF